ncbi:hypothetical protein BG004_005750 [Podila humilis]|nr:hypothetical protein BG004_005750 [Podila humilis]
MTASDLEQRKASEDIHIIESMIPKFSRETIMEYITYMESKSQAHPTISSARQVLTAFYNGSWFRKRSWDSKKGQRSAMDIAIKRLFHLAGGSEGKKRTEDQKAVFCIGLGSFNTRTGLPSKHSAFEQLFVRKAKPSGYLVVGTNEYFTSAKCPRLECQEFLQPAPRRSRYCPSCQFYVDRDVAAAENIARICRDQLNPGFPVDGYHRRRAKYMPK